MKSSIVCATHWYSPFSKSARACSSTFSESPRYSTSFFAYALGGQRLGRFSCECGLLRRFRLRSGFRFDEFSGLHRRFRACGERKQQQKRQRCGKNSFHKRFLLQISKKNLAFLSAGSRYFHLPRTTETLVSRSVSLRSRAPPSAFSACQHTDVRGIFKAFGTKDTFLSRNPGLPLRRKWTEAMQKERVAKSKFCAILFTREATLLL